LQFGAGPRQCLGMRIARHEAKILIYQILRHYRYFKTFSLFGANLQKQFFQAGTMFKDYNTIGVGTRSSFQAQRRSLG